MIPGLRFPACWMIALWRRLVTTCDLFVAAEGAAAVAGCDMYAHPLDVVLGHAMPCVPRRPMSACLPRAWASVASGPAGVERSRGFGMAIFGFWRPEMLLLLGA